MSVVTESARVQIHSTAVVEDGVVVGGGTRIWHHTHVRAQAHIGEACVLGKNVFVDAGVRIGDRCKIQNNVSIYTGVTLEDEVFVGPSAVFTNDLYPRARSESWEVIPTLVRTGASIGANATILCGVTIGRGAMIGAGSVVTAAVLDHTLVRGNPARPVGRVCVCGRPISGDASPTLCAHVEPDR